jgi:hypothetical protein
MACNTRNTSAKNADASSDVSSVGSTTWRPRQITVAQPRWIPARDK